MRASQDCLERIADLVAHPRLAGQRHSEPDALERGADFAVPPLRAPPREHCSHTSSYGGTTAYSPHASQTRCPLPFINIGSSCRLEAPEETSTGDAVLGHRELRSPGPTPPGRLQRSAGGTKSLWGEDSALQGRRVNRRVFTNAVTVGSYSVTHGGDVLPLPPPPATSGSQAGGPITHRRRPMTGSRTVRCFREVDALVFLPRSIVDVHVYV